MKNMKETNVVANEAVVERTEEKSMKKTWKNLKGKIVTAFAAGLVVANAHTATAWAAPGTEAITQPLDNLKTLVIAIIGAVGIIILAKNVMEFAQAYQQQDSSTMSSALKGIVAGILMAGISTVLAFLGF